MSSLWYLSSQRMTVGGETDELFTITRAAPIVRRFVGQPLSNLIQWMLDQPGPVYVEPA